MPVNNPAPEDLVLYLKAVLDSTTQGFYAVNTEGETTLCNMAFLTMLGFGSAEEVIGKKLHGVIHHTRPDGSHYDVSDCPIYRAASGGRRANVSHEVFFKKNGTRLPVEYRAEPVYQDGVLKGAVCTFTDISERLRIGEDLEKTRTKIDTAEEEYHRLQEQLKLAQEAAGIGLFTIDVKANEISASPEFFRIYGFPEGSAKVPADFERLCFPEDRALISTEKSRREGTASLISEYRITRAGDGEIRWISRRSQMIYDGEGRPAMMIGAAVDVTEQKNQSLVLQESREQYRYLFDHIDEGFCVFDMVFDQSGKAVDYVFVQVNPAFERHTGLKNAAGRSVREIVPDLEESWYQRYGEVATTGQAVRFQQFAQSLDGRDFDIYAFPVKSPGQNRVAAIFQDITMRERTMVALREAKSEAEAANIAKTEFLANMSHEIRTPMNAIMGLTNILAMSSPLNEKQRQFLSTLQISADGMLSLVNDLLDISKIEARTVELEEIPFSLEQLVEEVISMMTVRVKEKGLTFTGTIECGEGGFFLGDPTRIRQIVLNLCSNAIKFTDQGTVHILVACGPSLPSGKKEVSFIITDTGIGIAADKIGKIFDKFVQADSSINRKYGGTGLGLAITKMLTDVMGGEISVRSETGRGSEFRVTLPLAPIDNEDGKTVLPKTASQGVRHISRPRILLVEDYEPNVIVASTLLENFGYEVDVASNGFEAVDMAITGRYRVVLMDVQMHGMNGLEATSLIRGHERLNDAPHVAVIGMTAHALSGDRERCLGVGMDDYISKPFNADELDQKIREHLKAA